MMRFRFPWFPLLFGAFLLCAGPAVWAQTPAQSPHDLVKDVVYNELQERRQASLWQYKVEKRVGTQTTIAQQVETVSGPVSRVFFRQGKPLDTAAQKKETDRLNSLVHNTGEQARMQQDYESEEKRTERLIAAMPDAFLYTYESPNDENIRLSFQPNPAYTAQTYEARVYHALAGEIWIQPQAKRLVRIDGHIASEIDFGYGFFGKIEKGGTFQIGRALAGEHRWKTSLLDVHISGRLVFFKAISKDQREVRSNFEPMPAGTSVQDAVTLLNAMPRP